MIVYWYVCSCEHIGARKMWLSETGLSCRVVSNSRSGCGLWTTRTRCAIYISCDVNMNPTGYDRRLMIMFTQCTQLPFGVAAEMSGATLDKSCTTLLTRAAFDSHVLCQIERDRPFFTTPEACIYLSWLLF